MFVGLHSIVSAQLLVDGSLSLDSLAKVISGKGVQIFNAQVDCGTNGFGLYNATNTSLGVNEGLIIATGSIGNAIGPNNVGNKSTVWTQPYNGNPQTYPLLDNYTGRTTYEYCEFEFDIVPQGDTISFDFVFASEEYEEWVGSQYNDVFGFFISGPGIVPDPGAGIYRNIALVPNSSTPVTINNVNQNSNTAYYQNNDNSQLIQYDGYTTGLTAISEVQPCQTYHLILVVADASDKIYDSGVFIEKINSNNVLLLSKTAGNIPFLVEGCNDGDVTFKRPAGQANSNPLNIQYWLDGTATNGLDYVQIGANPNPLIPKSITIPAGLDSIDLPIVTILDTFPEISEYIMVYLGNPFCSNEIIDSLQFFLQDSLFPTITPKIDSFCIGNNTQMGATGGSIFSWSPITGLDNPNIPNPIATPLATTTYTMTTTASFCIETRSVSLYVSNMSLLLDPINVDCNGNNNGSIDLTVFTGLPPYTYSWTGPAGFTSTNKNINSLIPGTYTVFVIDAEGCSTSGNLSITEPEQLSANLVRFTYNGGYNISCNGLFDGSISLTPSGGTLPYSYSWIGPNGFTSSIQNISGLEAGTYSVLMTDTNGCTTNASITLTQPAALIASISNSVDVGCKGESTGSALSNLTGGTPPYTYSWNSNPVQTNPAAINLFAGNYTVFVTDHNSCIDSAMVVINEPTDSLSALITSVTNVLCKGDATGSATVLPSGGTTSYNYVWNTSPGQFTASAINLLAGNYTVTVTDSKNCSVSLPVTISEPQIGLGVIITDSVDVLCKGDNNGSATALASGGSGSYSYTWNSTPPQSTPTAVGLIAGAYIVNVTDNNGCTTPSSANVNINEPALNLSSSTTLSSYTGGFNVSCYNALDGSVNQSIVGGTVPYIVLWTGPNGFTSSLENISGLEAGTYYLSVIDANLCTYLDSATLIEPSEIVVTSIVTPASCGAFNDGAINITVTGGVPTYTYSWVGPNSFTSSLEDISSLEGGTYTLTITDAGTCIKTLSIQVDQPGTLALTTTTSSFLGGSNISCKGAFDGSIDITPAGGTSPYSYAWTGPNGFNDTLQDITGLEAGVYLVILTDTNGCFTDSTVSLSEPNAVTISFVATQYNGGNNISCNGLSDGNINATPTGGFGPYSFSWTGPNSFTSGSQNISNLEAGIYFLTVTDTNGCIGIDSITLTEPDTLNGTSIGANYQGNYNISCFGLSNGSIDLTVTGGAAPYNYSWVGPNSYTSNLEDINNLEAGTYTVQITDDNGCIDSTLLSFILTQPDSLELTTSIFTYNGGYNVSCNGFFDGAINLNVIGGTAPFTFNWSNSVNTEDLNNIAAGTYSVIVTDTNGCVANTATSLTQPQALQSGLASPIFVGGFNVSCSASSDGAIDLQVAGGTPSYTYNWIGPNAFSSNVQDPSNLTAGTYQVNILDTNGCSAVNFITLLEPSKLNLTLNSPTFIGGFNLSCNNDSTGAIDLTTTGGVPTYTYNWTGPNSFSEITEDVTGLKTGMHYITVTDTNGCIEMDSLLISEPNSLSSSVVPSLFVGGNNISCNGLNDGVIDLTMSGGNPSYNYSWSGPGGVLFTSEDISGGVAGTYVVNVLDTNGCAYDTSITLTEPLALQDSLFTLTYFGGNNISCSGLSDGAINAFTSGGNNPYSINWSGPNSYSSVNFNNSGLEAGNYNYTITDTNNCTLLNSVELTQPDTLKSTLTTTIFASGNSIACMGDSSGIIFTAVTGGNPGFTYNWTNSGSFNSSQQNPDSLYVSTYYLVLADTNGCTWNDSLTLSEPSTSIAGSITPSIYPSGDNISCFGFDNGTLMGTAIDGTSGYIYDWRGPNGYSNNTAFIDSLVVGDYDLVIIDSNGCSVSLSYSLQEPISALALNDSSSIFPNGLNISCNGASDGAVMLSPTGGSPSYLFNWTSNIGFNAITEDISGLSSGDYYINLSDTNGCVLVDTMSISQPDSTNINSIITPAICGNAIGSINLFPEGNGPFTYQWSNGDVVSFITGLKEGLYSVFVTDSFGCIDSAFYDIDNITNPMSLNLFSPTFTGSHNTSQNNGSDGSIDLTIIGGTPPFVINWSNGAVVEDITNLQAGTYSVSVIDDNGCESFATITLTEALSLEMPTGITPNGDGKNDFFLVRGLEVYPDNEIVIFNRWGNEVFSQTGYQNDWAGTSSGGDDVPEGTYFVILKIPLQNLELKGFVDIRR